MILHPPQTRTQDDSIIIWSKVELTQERADFPSYLWFRLPQSHAQFISLHSDAFLVSCLLAAMTLGEPLDVRGSVSPYLVHHLQEYQLILSLSFPHDLQPVEITYHHLLPPIVKPHAVGAAFSGGVDSLYTLLCHLPKKQPLPAYQITHALFIHGFDIFNNQSQAYNRFSTIYENALRTMGIELIRMETNLVSAIIPRRNFAFFYSPVLAGCAHILAGLFNRFYIPSSWSYFQLEKRTSCSSPLTDHLLSSDTLEIIHHGATLQRVEKVKALIDWDFAQRILRVCPYTAFDGSEKKWYNCSHCEKCVRTMIPIYALGRMTQFRTFSKPLKTNRDGFRWARKYTPYPGFVAEVIPFVQQHKPDMLPWLRIAAVLGSLRYSFLKLLPLTVKNWLRKFGFFIDPFDQKNTYENPQVIQHIQSSL